MGLRNYHYSSNLQVGATRQISQKNKTINKIFAFRPGETSPTKKKKILRKSLKCI